MAEFNAKELQNKLDQMIEYLEGFEGKKNCNPFLVINQTVMPLVARLNKGEKTPELEKAINALQKTPPIVVKEAPVTSAPIKEVEVKMPPLPTKPAEVKK